jgi:acyl-coenzyme A synthetase/AMP-(fatty) acid ligase
MKRAVLCVSNPQDYMLKLHDYSIMVVDPVTEKSRMKYLLDSADWSLLITDTDEQLQNGGDYPDERVLWYTSGTTGDSKFRSFTQQQIDLLAETICQSYQLTANDRYLSIMPLWHAHGQGMFWATQQAQCEIKYLGPKKLNSEIDFSPTFISAIPDILKILMKYQFKDLRFVRSASSPLSDHLFYAIKEHTNVPVIEAFGMTEALSHCFTNPLNGEQRVGTVGLPDGIEAKIVDGNLHIKGPSLFQPGWYDTGDMAELDNAGYYRILGRKTDRLNIRGFKIDPVSIENQLHNKFIDIGEVVVFGDNKLMCVYTGNSDQHRIKNAIINISKYCSPKMIKRVDEIPKNNAGKISRSMLTALYKS